MAEDLHHIIIRFSSDLLFLFPLNLLPFSFGSLVNFALQLGQIFPVSVPLDSQHFQLNTNLSPFQFNLIDILLNLRVTFQLYRRMSCNSGQRSLVQERQKTRVNSIILEKKRQESID